ncbi:MAG: hypothetical protein ACLGH0_14220, partial [Thermoanaerobaculia bacterium]
KDGDRIILMTFDTDARVHGIVPVVERRRDVELLHEAIDGIDVRRVVRYSGTWPALSETPDGPWPGGGASSDYCEMWRLSARVVRKFGSSAHRQWFLLLTDGPSEAPAYRPCGNPGVPGAFSAALQAGRVRLAVFALPVASSSAEGLSTYLRELLRDVPARIVDFGRLDDVRHDVLELFNARVDLAAPLSLHLGSQSTVDLRTPVTLVNRSPVERTVTIRDVSLHLQDAADALHIRATPSSVTLLPHQSATIVLARGNVIEEPGRYRGHLIFHFAPGSRFDPAAVPFSVTKLTRFEAFGAYAPWPAIGATVFVIVAGLWFAVESTRHYAPVTITGHYRGDPLARPSRAVHVGAAAAFGGGGAVPGELFVNTNAPSGLLLRAGANEWQISWDGTTFEPYASGTAVVPPGGTEGDAWWFLIEMDAGWSLAGMASWLRSKLRRTR